jgi:ABC-type Co2+ transport system permease subunit
MLLGSVGPLFAVHIHDGILQGTWLAGGFVIAAVFAALAAWRIRDEEIPRIALLTAAFFVASSIHIRVGPTSWHLLLNGLVGVLLGRRAGLAILIGLAMQYFILHHGGFYTLGINTCVLLFPALLASGLFTVLRKAPWLRRRWFRAVLIGISAFVLVMSGACSVALLASNRLLTNGRPIFEDAYAVTIHPLTIGAALAIAALAVAWESRLKTAPEFALGLLVGELTVLVTIMLNYLVLVRGGDAVDWTVPAQIMLVLHLPIAALEGIALGFLVAFLARVKPEMLGLIERDSHERALDVVADNAGAAGNGEPRAGTLLVRAPPRAAGEQGSDRELLPGREPGR